MLFLLLRYMWCMFWGEQCVFAQLKELMDYPSNLRVEKCC